jgi:hypothetical protein
MHYPFGPGLILEPEDYRNGLEPIPGLSDRDKAWVRTIYPQLHDDDYKELKLAESCLLNITPGDQRNFVIRPSVTRYYDVRTFGTSDTVIVLFEEQGGELRYVTADDDSGEESNAAIHWKLFKDHKYVLRIRLYYRDSSGETAVMMW